VRGHARADARGRPDDVAALDGGHEPDLVAFQDNPLRSLGGLGRRLGEDGSASLFR
jgi:hypothetical protein